MTTPLHIALATALLHVDRHSCSTLSGPTATTAAVLSDPAFLAALAESIAEALYVENMSVRGSEPNASGGYLTADEVATAIVARMLEDAP